MLPPGKHMRHHDMLVAHDVEAFAEEVVHLLRDRALQCRLARSGQQPVEGKCTWQRSVALLEGVYGLAIERRVLDH